MKQVSRVVNGICSLSGAVSMVLTVIMVVYLIVDVFCRVVLKSPLKGTYELAQIAICIIIFSAFPYVQSKRRAIIVSMFLNKLPLMIRTVVSMITTGLGVFITVIMTRAIFYQGNIVMRNNKITDILNLPLYPIYYLTSLFIGILALVLIVDFIKHIFALFGDEYCKEDIARMWR